MPEPISRTQHVPEAPAALPQPAHPPFLPLLLLLFIGSGCSALIYEIVWLQLFELVIGATAISLGILLGTFMGGMCLGSWLLARVVPISRHPLRVYAALELGIGAIAVLVLYAMPHIERLYAAGAGGSWVTSIALRSLISILCLLPPTVFMGATLPAISRWVRMTPEGVSWLGFFYGGNIVGAVLGCLLAGFYLLPAYDMFTASFVAAALNLAVAAVALLLAALSPYQTGHPSETHTPLIATPRASARPVYLAIAISGFTALGAEVVWTRLLSLLLGPTVYTFSIILAAFLVGLGIGSAAGAWLGRRSRPRAALGGCQLLLAAALAWGAYTLAGCLPYWPVNPSIALKPWFSFQLDLVRSLCVVLPGAILWGASFPLALAAVGSADDPGRLVGRVYAANTLGAILGALACSMLLIPTIGTQWTQRLLLALCALSAAIVISPLVRPPRSTPPSQPFGATSSRSPAPLLACVAVVLLAWSVPAMPWLAVAFGRHCATYAPHLYPPVLTDEQVQLLKQADDWRIRLHLRGDDIVAQAQVGSSEAGLLWLAAMAPRLEPWIATHRAALLSALRQTEPIDGERSSAAYGGGLPNRYCLFLAEGINVSVAVTETRDGLRYFHGAGKIQASTNPQDMRLQRMLGHLPMLLRKDPDSAQNILVVACGAGVTAGSFIPYDTVRRLVVCDIEPVVPRRVAPLFAAQNYSVVADPRTQVVVDDGRHFLHTTGEKFDIITSDPIDPWVKGCAALNTVEYYRMCKAHLNPGGVMALWIPLYESDLASAKSAIATFFQAFPDGMIWSNDSVEAGYDIVLLGRADPTQSIDLDRLQEWISAHPRVRQSLADVGFGVRAQAAMRADAPETAIDLIATYSGQAQDLLAWTADAQINTDANLRLQYLAGLALNRDLGTAIFDQIMLHYRFPAGLVTGSPTRIAALTKAFQQAGRIPTVSLHLPSAPDPAPPAETH